MSDAIYFYGHKNEYGFMSNFYPCVFKLNCTINGVKQSVSFNCSEQYFTFKKCMMFDENNTMLIHQILTEDKPSKIKALGRQVVNFDGATWDQHKFKIMMKALKYKFGQNEELMMMLQMTRGKILYEASPKDKIWGIGMNAIKGIASDPSTYGQNLLGQSLMIIRDGE